MLDNEQTVKWLIVLGIAATLVLYRVAGKRSDRKRREWFESVATAFGARAEHVSEFASTFRAEVDQRSCAVSYRHSSHVGWRLAGSIPLHGVSDIFNFVLRSSDAAGDDGVRVRNFGCSPRDGWLNAEVRDAVLSFLEHAPRRAELHVEGGNLTWHTADRLEGTALRTRVGKLVPVAEALERTL